jgi:hypothetical protein
MSSHPLCPYCGDVVDLEWAVEVKGDEKHVAGWYHEDCAERAGITRPSVWDVKEGQDYE